MEGFDMMDEEKKEEKKVSTDATHIDQYGIVVTKANLEKIKERLAKLLEKGFTINISATKQDDFNIE